MDDEFDQYVRARYHRLCRAAFLLCDDWQRAEDLVQTALAKTYEARQRRRIDDLDAYVRRVLVTTNISLWRRRRPAESSGNVPDTPAPDEFAHVDARLAALRALRALPREQRTVLALLYVEDLSADEAARVLGCPVGTVKSRAARALASLRAQGTPAGVAPADLGGAS